MIRVEPPPEPEHFHDEVRVPGRAWLDDPLKGVHHRAKSRPRSFWTEWAECPRALAEGFHARCGYTASQTLVHQGNVDHFVSWAECRASERHHLAYEWSNLRWLDARINTNKGRLDGRALPHALLDPFEVRDEWFRLDVLSLTLCMTDAVPPDLRARVEYTLRALGLTDGPIVMAQRHAALRRFRAGMSLAQLDEEDPLVARALRALLDAPEQGLVPAHLEFRRTLLHERERARAAARAP
jgi:hypothetical protein